MGKRHGKKLPQVVRTDQDIRNLMHDEFNHFLTDIEYRLKQTYEVERRVINAAEHGLSDSSIERLSNARVPVMAGGSVYAEDLSLNTHMITGYTVTANTPAAGQIAWTNLHIVFGGVDYTVADGNAATTDYYLWFQLSTATTTGATGTATLQKNIVTNKPTLTNGDAIVFLNNAGTPVKVMEMNIPPVVANNAVDAGAIQSLAITAGKIANNTITATQISNTANITGTQLSSTAGLVGGQLASNANIAGTQISPTANLVGSQLTAGTIGNNQLGVSAVQAKNLSVFDHQIY